MFQASFGHVRIDCSQRNFALGCYDGNCEGIQPLSEEILRTCDCTLERVTHPVGIMNVVALSSWSCFFSFASKKTAILANAARKDGEKTKKVGRGKTEQR